LVFKPKFRSRLLKDKLTGLLRFASTFGTLHTLSSNAELGSDLARHWTRARILPTDLIYAKGMTS